MPKPALTPPSVVRIKPQTKLVALPPIEAAPERRPLLDAPGVTVMRGATQTGRVEPVLPPPGVNVVRGARPRAADVLTSQPGALLIRVPQ